MFPADDTDFLVHYCEEQITPADFAELADHFLQVIISQRVFLLRELRNLQEPPYVNLGETAKASRCQICVICGKPLCSSFKSADGFCIFAD